MKKGESRKKENKRIRQEALRDSLTAGGHLQHVIDIAAQLSDIDTEIDAHKVLRLKAAADIKLKLISKYLPDLKAIEHSDPDGNSLIPPNMIFQPLVRPDS